MAVRPAPDWFSDTAKAFWDALPDVTYLVFADVNDALTARDQDDLLNGDLEYLNDVDGEARFEAADQALDDLCGPGLAALTPDERDELRWAIEERDQSAWLVEQLARNTGVLTVGLPIPDPLGPTGLAGFLGLPDDEPVNTPLPLDESLDSRELVHVLCHLRADDLVRIALASPESLVTLPAVMIGNDDEYCGELPVDLKPGATVCVQVAELRADGWVASPGPGVRGIRQRYLSPSRGDVPAVVLDDPPPHPAVSTYLGLRSDGWPTRDALSSAIAMEGDADAMLAVDTQQEHPTDPPRKISLTARAGRAAYEQAAGECTHASQSARADVPAQGF